MFLNIIKNGIDSIDGEGLIIIETKFIEKAESENSPFVQININDDGKGIPEEKLEKLFDAFYTTKDHGQGTGLGLFITNIIDKHNGTIEVKSKTNEGTEFIVQIPALQ